MDEIKVGISQIRSARREYIMNFWDTFFSTMNVKYEYSTIDIMEAYKKGRDFLGTSNSYCFFRYLDIGQHIDLIEKGCNYLILLSLREKNKRFCNTENYVAEHLSLFYPNIKIINFFMHIDDIELRNKEITKLASNFKIDLTNIDCVLRAWPENYIDKNRYFNGFSKEKINLLIIGDIYYFLNPRMKNSPYVELLQKKFNCNIITPIDISDISIQSSKNAYADD